MALLELEGVEASYGRIRALRGISLVAEKGEIVALIGSNGAGKTTTLRTISGLMHPAAGSIVFNGKHITNEAPDRIVQLGICQSPEGRRLFTRMTVVDNLRMGAYTRSNAGEIKKDMDRVFELFPRLKERRNQIAGTLSGGEQQMCAIGRALMAEPRLLVIDELSLGLAPAVVDKLLDALIAIREAGTALLVIDQDAGIALSGADRAYVMRTGRVVLDGIADDVLGDPHLQREYIGL